MRTSQQALARAIPACSPCVQTGPVLVQRPPTTPQRLLKTDANHPASDQRSRGSAFFRHADADSPRLKLPPVPTTPLQLDDHQRARGPPVNLYRAEGPYLAPVLATIPCAEGAIGRVTTSPSDLSEGNLTTVETRASHHRRRKRTQAQQRALFNSPALRQWRRPGQTDGFPPCVRQLQYEKDAETIYGSAPLPLRH